MLISWKGGMNANVVYIETNGTVVCKESEYYRKMYYHDIISTDTISHTISNDRNIIYTESEGERTMQ